MKRASKYLATFQRVPFGVKGYEKGIEKRLGAAYRLHENVEVMMGAPITVQEYR